jgi:hypothetical protein
MFRHHFKLTGCTIPSLARNAANEPLILCWVHTDRAWLIPRTTANLYSPATSLDILRFVSLLKRNWQIIKSQGYMLGPFTLSFHPPIDLPVTGVMVNEVWVPPLRTCTAMAQLIPQLAWGTIPLVCAARSFLISHQTSTWNPSVIKVMISIQSLAGIRASVQVLPRDVLLADSNCSLRDQESGSGWPDCFCVNTYPLVSSYLFLLWLVSSPYPCN